MENNSSRSDWSVGRSMLLSEHLVVYGFDMENNCSRSDRRLATGCSLNIVFFSLKVFDFSELCQFCGSAALVFYLPDMCTHTDTKEKQRKARVRNILKSSEKTHII